MMDTEYFKPFPLELYPDTLFQRLGADDLFGCSEAPLEIDLGCGDGRFLQAMAEACPGTNFLGVERLLGRVRKVCRRCERAGLTNVRVLRLETSYAVEWLLPRRSAQRVHLLFPDPWPKKASQTAIDDPAGFFEVGVGNPGGWGGVFVQNRP